MTKDFVTRTRSHGKRFVSIVEEYVNVPSKAAARGLEQIKIDGAKLKNLENKINSISKKNPKLAEYYREALQYLKSL